MDGFSELFRNDRSTICAVLRRYIGKHGISVADASRDTGIPVPTIYQHLDTLGSVQPKATMILAYMALDNRIANDLLGLVGLGAVPIVPSVICPFHHLTETTRFSLDLSTALEDRHLDHQERMYLAPLARQRGSAQFAFAEYLEAA